MELLIGIDGGGTKTDCAAADSTGKVLHLVSGKASNVLINGIEESAENFFGLIEECLFEIRADFSDIKQILIGTAGAGREEDANHIEKRLEEYSERERIHLNSVKVVSDAHIALEGAFAGNPGCILIAGTGSILYGKDEEGKIYRAGGFGRIIGDEGSGYTIGRKGLNAVSKELDGRGNETLITKLLNKEFNIFTTDDLIKKVYNEHLDIASVTKFVIEAAGEGDIIASDILKNESKELALHIKSMQNKMSSKKLNITLLGSLIEKNNIYSEILKETIKTNHPEVKITKPQNPPVVGAVQLAKILFSAKGGQE